MRESVPAGLTTPLEATGKTAGEYVLRRKLGEGGCGAVYEAEHPVLMRRAAVKVLHRVPVKGSASLLRFVAEAKAVNQIRSRHIVDVFSFGELDDGRPFYVMDLLEGEPLDTYMARLGPLDVADLLAIVRPIVASLDIAHAAGIVHRDLKPKNIFLALESNSEVVPKLLDFGVAKLMHDTGELTLSGAVLGTPLYMSPEQARGERVDLRSDVYALGVLVYEMITGMLPLKGDTLLAIAMAQLTEIPRRPSEVASVHAALDAPILRMLDKSPDGRPRSAGEAFAELCAAAESAGAIIPPNTAQLPAPIKQTAHNVQLATTVDDPKDPVSSERPRAAPLANSARTKLGDGRPRRALLLAVSLLVALGLALYLMTPSAPTASEPSAPTPAPAALEPPAEPTAPVAPAAEKPTEPVQEKPVEPAKPKRKRRAPAREDIPKDLENPF